MIHLYVQSSKEWIAMASNCDVAMVNHRSDINISILEHSEKTPGNLSYLTGLEGSLVAQWLNEMVFAPEFES